MPEPDSRPDPACPPGNLLRGRARQAETTVGAARVHDGLLVAEGTTWDAPQAARLDGSAALVTFDFGQLTHVGYVWAQADANDLYGVRGSVDGTTWEDVGVLRPVDGHGLRSRGVAASADIRYLQVGAPEGDGAYSIAEVAAFCAPPDDPRAGMRVLAPPVPAAASWKWDDTTSARWEGVLAVFGFVALVASSRWPARRAASALLALAGVLGLLSFFNFGAFHFGNTLHDWDYTHYHLGARFFPELGYDRLYRCIAVADAEDGQRRRVEARRITNLETNVIESASTVLRDPTLCTSHFTPERWKAFRADVKYWRSRQGVKRWEDLQLDHGFNATPAWTLLGHHLADTGPMTTWRMWALAALDPLAVLASFCAAWWAFGWRATAVAAVVFGTNFPSRFYWTGGSYLRFDWLLWLFAGAALLRRDRPALAGAALAWSAWLRLFPALLFAGPALVAADALWNTRRLPAVWARFFGGAVVASALLVGLSFVEFGADVWPEFIDNTVKHAETPLTNHMGLRTALSWRPEDAGRELRDAALVDPWLPWKEARQENWREARPLAAVVIVASLALLFRAVRRQPPWVAALAGLGFVPFGLELTCYYYAFVAVMALLVAVDRGAGLLLLAAAAATQFLAWAPIPGMARWMDEQYAAMSVVTCVAVWWVWWRLGAPGDPVSRRGAARIP